MVGIGINKKIKEELEQLNNNSIDEILKELINNYSINNNIIIDDHDSTNIRISKETLKKLKDLKYYPTESYNSVIFRLLYNDL